MDLTADTKPSRCFEKMEKSKPKVEAGPREKLGSSDAVLKRALTRKSPGEYPEAFSSESLGR